MSFLFISNEIILKHLKEALDSGAKYFPIILHISHLIISASGYNGCDIRNKAITLLNKYNEWLILNPIIFWKNPYLHNI